MKRIRFFKEVKCVRPTFSGWIIILVPAIVIFIFLFRNLDSFLSLNKPLESRILIVEGWVPDFAYPEIINEFKTKKYDLIITTGGEITRATMFTDYLTTAELTKASLIIMGIDTNKIVAIARGKVTKNRTFHSALSVKKWFEQNHEHPETVNLILVGVHTRRSRYLFQKAFGKEISVGSICLNDIGYDQSKWWRSSKGFRQVVNETLAYVYVKLFFRVPDNSLQAK